MQGQLSQYAIPKRCLSTSLNIPLSSQASHPSAIPIIKKFSRDVGVASLVLFNLLLLVWSIRDAQNDAFSVSAFYLLEENFMSASVL